MTSPTRFQRSAQGFTLVELMVTVALIGILAATAVTSFQFLQLRSRRSEAFANLSAIRKYQLSYFHENGSYVIAPASPAVGALGPKQAWQNVRGTFSSVPGTGFDILAFYPEGGTYFDYDTNAQNGAHGWAFTAAAYGDTDVDTNLSAFLYVSPDAAGGTLPSSIGGFTMPWEPSTCQPLLEVVAQVPWSAGCGFPVADDY
jgi:type IV pilus assembly protein PilE